MGLGAAFGPEGAVCVRRTRWCELLDLDALRAQCPRLAGRLGEACDESAPALIYFAPSSDKASVCRRDDGGGPRRRLPLRRRTLSGGGPVAAGHGLPLRPVPPHPRPRGRLH